MAAAASKRRLQNLMALMTMVGTAGGSRIPCSRLEKALHVDAQELQTLVDELGALSLRETGVSAAVSIEDGSVVYHGLFDLLPAVRLTASESTALSAALDDLGLDNEAREKIADALFGGEDRGRAETTARAIQAPQTGPLAARLIEAADVGVRCRILYQGHADTAPRNRLIDPHEVVESSDATYLVAWDYAEDAQRLFRIDRIAALEETDDSVDQHPYQPCSIDQGFASRGSTARVRFRTSAAYSQANWPGILRTAPANAGGIDVDVACVNESWLFDQILAAPRDRILIGPEDLQRRLCAYARSLLITP